MRSPRTSCSRATSFRSWRRRAGSWCAPATPRRAATWPSSPGLFVPLDLFDFDPARHAFSVQDAMRMVAHQKEGVIVLLRRPEPAAEILDRLDESPSRRAASRKWDPRLHGIGAQILKDLGVGKMRVLARPKRIPSMSGFGLEVVEYVSPDDARAVKAHV